MRLTRDIISRCNLPALHTKTHVHSRRSPPRHPLQVRPAGAAGPPGRALAARAALPQQRHLLLAAGRAGRALRQLDAGPVRQLPGAARVSREDARVQGHGRPRGRDGGLQPLRLLPRTAGRELPFQVHGVAGRRTGTLPRHRNPTSSPKRPRRCCRPTSTRSTARSSAPSTSWSASTSRSRRTSTT